MCVYIGEWLKGRERAAKRSCCCCCCSREDRVARAVGKKKGERKRERDESERKGVYIRVICWDESFCDTLAIRRERRCVMMCVYGCTSLIVSRIIYIAC